MIQIETQNDADYGVTGLVDRDVLQHGRNKYYRFVVRGSRTNERERRVTSASPLS